MKPKAVWISGAPLVRAAIVVIAAIAPGIAARPVWAQWYPGSVWANPWVPGPSSVDLINQAALDRIANAPSGAAFASGARTDRYTRDPEFFERYDIETRFPIADHVARKPRQTATPAKPAAPPAPAPATPVIPMASFFNRYNQLVWPADAPTQGELTAKRKATDQACLAVKEQTREKGAATIAAVTDARAKLLDYGKPALEYLRQHSTPAIMETFHVFLLSLYDALAQAASRRTAAEGVGRKIGAVRRGLPWTPIANCLWGCWPFRTG